eukprot:7083105-Prymnesium_polylepis.1
MALMTARPVLPVVHETSGLLFVHKPPGLSFHADVDRESGVMKVLRDMQHRGELEHDGPLHAVHRLDRVTSGLLMVAKSADAARDASQLLRTRRVAKYYVALSGRKPSKKQGTVQGDMTRSRRGQWMLQRSLDKPAVTCFLSAALPSVDGGGASTAARAERAGPLRAFLLKPLTGRTHQLRVAMKSLGSPVLGDELYAAADVARLEERAYLHASALRLPAGAALCDSGEPLQVLCPPSHGSEFLTDEFRGLWRAWFGDAAGGDRDDVWFEGTAVQGCIPRREE